MDVTWLGHGCFRLRGRNASVVTDPYGPELGLKLPRTEANLVTVSHGHPNHCHVEAIGGYSYVVDGPGEYEVSGVGVRGLPTYHDEAEGAEHGPNTVYVIEIDDVRVCHLGDLGHRLADSLVEIIGTVDVLLVPVGGGYSLSAPLAAEVVRQLEPRVVIPMHFALPGLKGNLESADRFLKEMGAEGIEAQPKLSIQSSSEAGETRVVLLEGKGQ